jgi:two-component system, NtrC family, sensor kinase
LKRNDVLLIIALASGAGIIGYTATLGATYWPVALMSLLVFVIWGVFFTVLRQASIRSEVNDDPKPDTGNPSSSLPQDDTAIKNQIETYSKQLLDMQNQIVAQEKMASVGMLTAGIAHEIKNPLNFINNFSDMTVEMLEELRTETSHLPESTPKELIDSIYTTIDDIATNCRKINEHGKRAESIIKNMLIQARSVEGEKSPCNLNSLLEEYLNLAYHGMRAQNNKLNAKIEKKLDPNLPLITVSPQNMGRVFLNIINNGLYATNEKAENLVEPHPPFMPTITATTEQDEDNVFIKIRDNGNGIPENLRTKIFEPFFTTKPTGKGTGLGLSICYDIVVKEHSGKLEILSEPNEFTEFIIILPKNNKS